eukprot:Skav218736  [mRNA]  locus=scaffold1346:901612:905340:+ [translate_table: standard]
MRRKKFRKNEVMRHDWAASLLATGDREVVAFFRDLDIEPSEAKFLFDMLLRAQEIRVGAGRRSLVGSPAMTEMDGVIREHEVYFATLAEQAERYDEMAEHMKSAEAPAISMMTGCREVLERMNE